jgi:tRNA A-37 threonylcarbamoyl transferase component Bud32
MAMAIRTGGLWRASLATVHEEGSRDGLAFLATGPDREQMLRAARALGHAIRRFHDVGGRHDDLHVGNLLLCESDADHDPRAVVIDLDRARVGTPPDAARRMRELMRLERSLRKRELVEQLGKDAIAAFFRAYHAGDTALRDALLEHYRD